MQPITKKYIIKFMFKVAQQSKNLNTSVLKFTLVVLKALPYKIREFLGAPLRKVNFSCTLL